MRRVGACDGCKRPGVQPGQCCRSMYVQLALLPTKEDRDWATWASYHEGVEIRGDFLFIRSPCLHLTDAGDCAIYDDRPDLCRAWPETPGDVELAPGCAYRFVDEPRERSPEAAE